MTWGRRRREQAALLHNQVQVLIAVRNTVNILADRADAPQPMHIREMARQLRPVVEVLDALLDQFPPPEDVGGIENQPLVARAKAVRQ